VGADERFLVTGVSGMIGAYVVEAAYRRGIRVVGLDRKAPPPHIQSLLESFVPADLGAEEQLALPPVPIDAVLHLAGISDLQRASEDPPLAWRVNVGGTSRVVRLAESHGIEHFILASSLYAGTPSGAEYGLSKLGAESFIRMCGASMSVRWSIVRIGSVYRRYAPETNTVQRVVSAALTGKPLRLNLSPESKRSYLHASDLAEILIDVVLSKSNEEIIAVEGSTIWRVKDVIKLAEEICERKIAWSSTPSTRYETTPLTQDLIRTVRPAEIEVSLPHGLQDVMDSMRRDGFAYSDE